MTHSPFGAGLCDNECMSAVAAGVSLMLSEKTHVKISQLQVTSHSHCLRLLTLHEPGMSPSCLQALSPVGRCKTFDEAADGYGRGEAVAVLLLSTLPGGIGIAVLQVLCVFLVLSNHVTYACNAVSPRPSDAGIGGQPGRPLQWPDCTEWPGTDSRPAGCNGCSKHSRTYRFDSGCAWNRHCSRRSNRREPCQLCTGMRPTAHTSMHGMYAQGVCHFCSMLACAGADVQPNSHRMCVKRLEP